MTWLEFARLVVAMRDAQKDYFHYGTRTALDKAKKLERQVDVALLQIMNGLPQQADMLASLYPAGKEG